MKVFVYGTLLRGEHNHRVLEEGGAVFVREATTRPEFTLVHLGGFPAMVAGGATAVLGEVFEVGDALRLRLDRLEGHPRFYCRTPIELADGSTADAYLLPARQARGPVIESGSWREAVDELEEEDA